nr:uncharacterized protein LOC117272990 isoform X2 [Nicotiana tomentosiformis]
MPEMTTRNGEMRRELEELREHIRSIGEKHEEQVRTMGEKQEEAMGKISQLIAAMATNPAIATRAARKNGGNHGYANNEGHNHNKIVGIRLL